MTILGIPDFFRNPEVHFRNFVIFLGKIDDDDSGIFSEILKCTSGLFQNRPNWIFLEFSEKSRKSTRSTPGDVYDK
jgi:hypothetical protein